MGNLLGKSKKQREKEKEREKERAQQEKMQAKISPEDKALLDLKNSRDKLKRFQKRCNLESKKLEEQIRQLLKKKNKEKALLLLKFKKLRETEVSKCNDQLLNVQTLINTLSFKKEEVQIFNALKEGNKALEAINKYMSIEAVQDLMDDTEENIQYQNEISAILSGTSVEEEDEIDLLKEIGWVEEQTQEDVSTKKEVDSELPQVPDTPILPVNPTSDIQLGPQENKESKKEEERHDPVLA